MGNCLSAEQNIPDCIRPLGFSAKLCTSSGVKLLRWSLDWSRMTIGFCCKTLHQFWCETVTVIAWLTKYDYWLLLRNFAPVLVWNFYGDCLTDYLRLLAFAAKQKGPCLLSGVNVYDERGNHPPHVETRVKYRKRYLTLRALFSAVRG